MIGKIRRFFRELLFDNKPRSVLIPASYSGVTIDENSALSCSAFWCGVNVISQTVASLPLKVYRRSNVGWQEDSDHGLSTILGRQPNFYHTKYKFIETMQLHLLLWGNAFARIVRDTSGEVKEIIPIHPRRVSRPYLKSTRVVYDVDLSTPSSPQKKIVTLPAEDIIHIVGLSIDGTYGLSVLEYARATLGQAINQDRFAEAFAKNAVRPSMILVHPSTLSDVARKNIEQDIQEFYAGIDKAFQVLLLEEGVDVKQLTMKMEDAQFVQGRQFTVTEIAMWLNLPPDKLKDLQRATYNNIEQQAIDFVVYSIQNSWLIRWEQELERKLLKQDERETVRIRFVIEGLLRGDTESRYRSYQIARQWGWLSVNEIRRLENLPPIGEGGDRYLEPLNMKEVGSVQETQDEND